MGGTQAGSTNRGSHADYVLGTAEGWDAFGVVRWHALEEVAQPFQYDIVLARPLASGAVDLDKLLDAPATFRIASERGWRVVHGVLAQAEEIDRTSTTLLYRVLLVPHLWHARYRRRCRNFLDTPLRDILSAVLENRSPAHPRGLGGLAPYSDAQAPDEQPSFSSFVPASATYRFDVKDPGRLLDPAAYPYVVQYNESDFDFFSRLLEQEGLSYGFEHGRDQVVLAITDRPGVSPLFDGEPTFDLRRAHRTGGAQGQEIVRSFIDARRMRSRAVTVRDWDYFRSARPLQATVSEAQDDPDLARHFEFPGGEDLVKQDPCKHAAQVRMERYDAERALREGSSTVRTMEPGYRFTLHDSDGALPDQKLLAVRVETYATERALEGTILDEEPFGFAGAAGAPAVGYDSRFAALPAHVPFRPAMRAPKPRIQGVQTAVVTAEEYPEGERPVVNGDSLGRVRVRFPWDQRDDSGDGTPTSRWIRVSQLWAGAGYGALYTPRVGHEVLVAYLQGDPDHPVIVGRVYNKQHPPPYDASAEPTRSTVRTQSAEQKKEVDGFNEIRFEDRAHQEEIYLHAQRDLNEVVLASHSTSVGGDQSNAVGGDQTNTVKGHSEHTVGGDEAVTVGGKRDVTAGADQTYKTTGNFVSEASGNHVLKSTNAYVYPSGDFQVDSTSAGFNQTASFYVKAGSASISIRSGQIELDNGAGAKVALVGGLVVIDAGACVVVKSGSILDFEAGAMMSARAGATMDLNGGGAINAKAGVIKLDERARG
jgi:type VI secretion system secreted protein VgrG